MTKNEFEDIITWGYIQMDLKGTLRRDLSPANTHPGRVAIMLKNKGLRHLNDDEQDNTYAIVAFFHDMIEDGIATYEEILQVAGKRIADAVLVLSKDPRVKHDDAYMEEYISEIGKDILTKNVKVADRIDNVREPKGLKNKRGYVIETEKWILGLAKGTVFEEDLEEALQKLRELVEEEEAIRVRAVAGEEIR